MRTAFVIEHDSMMMAALADRMILFTGKPGIETTAHRPMNTAEAFNKFLKSLDVTFRRDPSNFRPRINKEGSRKDTEQKNAGQYYIVEVPSDDEEEEDDGEDGEKGKSQKT